MSTFYFVINILLLLLSSHTVELSKTPITVCNTNAPNILEAEVFAPNAVLATLTRKNVYSLTAAEISSIKAGISAMKALPTTDPTSWTYQAAIHGTTLTNNLASWNSCQHGTQFFLSWHRMYLYYFERILRSKSGNPNLTLPYWNYQTNPVLHPDYRNNAPGNTLYDGTRNASINGGGSLPASIMTSIVNSLNNIPFGTFNSTLEGPHGSVHVSIGGNMGAVNKAAKDPVFWLHHTNIDRLWQEWLRKCGGRANPTTGPWTTQVFTFFDENGNAKNMTGAQIVNTAAQLGYVYDFPFKLPCNFKFVDIAKWKWVEVIPFKLSEDIRINTPKIDRNFEKININNWNEISRIQKLHKFNITDKDVSDQVAFELEGISISKLPEGVIEVYLNQPENERPSPESKYFVGVLDLFSATGHTSHNNHGKLRIDASHTVKGQNLSMEQLKKSKLTFNVRGNGAKGTMVKTSGDVSIKSVSLIVRKGIKS